MLDQVFQMFSKHNDQTVESENILGFPKFDDIFLAKLWGAGHLHMWQMRM